jgi:hypothetical protein
VKEKSNFFEEKTFQLDRIATTLLVNRRGRVFQSRRNGILKGSLK